MPNAATIVHYTKLYYVAASFRVKDGSSHVCLSPGTQLPSDRIIGILFDARRCADNAEAWEEADAGVADHQGPEGTAGVPYCTTVYSTEYDRFKNEYIKKLECLNKSKNLSLPNPPQIARRHNELLEQSRFMMVDSIVKLRDNGFETITLYDYILYFLSATKDKKDIGLYCIRKNSIYRVIFKPCLEIKVLINKSSSSQDRDPLLPIFLLSSVTPFLKFTGNNKTEQHIYRKLYVLPSMIFTILNRKLP
ncbi:hypothetical protein AGLY_015003 [Aphis glycines]|uniref:Uncharacterized protein n=1 Tax=Aphis glycines TaxID=307491 RepID=A0A6G0T2U0_APHGL|nr:hypothetical protein AGLY_015003 [Aphis glycines]